MKLILSILINILILSVVAFTSEAAFDSQSASFSLAAENKDIENITEVQNISELLDNLEKTWNEHNVDKLSGYYSDDFINGDGLSLDSINKLTKDLWEAYPDIKTKSKERTIRAYDEYATVESVDIFEGGSSMVRPEVDSFGMLKAISIGELFLKKVGQTWQITSDKTIFEKVSIAYALGSELVDQNKIRLITPEQVAANQEYTARLELDLPPDVKPVAAISKEMLTYPQLAAEDKFRLINESKLERLLRANGASRNELITATIGLTGGAMKPKLLGLVFLSRRVNVVPVSTAENEFNVIKTPARSALSKSKESIDFYVIDEEEILPPEKSEDNEQDPSEDKE